MYTQAVRNSFGFPFPIAKSYDLYASHYDLFFFLFCFRLILLLYFVCLTFFFVSSPLCDLARLTLSLCATNLAFTLYVSVELVLCPCFICMCNVYVRVIIFRLPLQSPPVLFCFLICYCSHKVAAADTVVSYSCDSFLPIELRIKLKYALKCVMNTECNYEDSRLL